MKKNILIILIITTLIATLGTGCSSNSKNSLYKKMSGKTLNEVMEEDDFNFIITDIRDKAEFDKAHLKNSVHFDSANKEESIKNFEKYKENKIVIVSDDDSKSKKIAEFFANKGFALVYVADSIGKFDYKYNMIKQ